MDTRIILPTLSYLSRKRNDSNGASIQTGDTMTNTRTADSGL